MPNKEVDVQYEPCPAGPSLLESVCSLQVSAALYKRGVPSPNLSQTCDALLRLVLDVKRADIS
jgi:hypothetical protein